MSTTTDANREVCSECGVLFESTDWHPAMLAEPDCDALVRSFCSKDCRDSWSNDS